MLRRVLVPLDGSLTMAAVFPALRRLLGGTGGLVHLLAVRPPISLPARQPTAFTHAHDLRVAASPGAAPADSPPARRVCLDELLVQERAHWLDYLRRHGSHLAYDGIVVQREVRFGEPVAETLAAAERAAIELIAVAAPPQPRLARLLRPSFAQRLLAQAAIPVLTVPAERPLWQGVALRYDRAPA
ncbi:MAG TPA: universal stress protein [Chloroflexota bacterium]|jgi:nucleotide-binding universal stress UspA family protein